MNDAGETVSSNPNPTLTLSLPLGVELGDEVLLMNGSAVIIRQSVTLRDLASAAIDMPITAAVVEVLQGRLAPAQAVARLMGRDARSEGF
jgi:glycerol-3-phosphate dehydrogenase (NAD(P)+)